MQPLVRYSYENVVTFGGCQEDFMLVVTSEASDVDSIKRGLHLLESDRASSEDSAGTTKLLFNAGKPQVNALCVIFMILVSLENVKKCALGGCTIISLR